MSRILRIKASAGAGKTYRLSLRYLELLKTFKEKKDIRSIVAITFTNKAAYEMKDRIILFLKKLALNWEDCGVIRDRLGVDDYRSWALNWIEAILDNYTDFRVRTIDSLLFSILKALSFEIGISPEVEVVFDSRDLFDEAFNLFIENMQEHRTLWDSLLETFFELDDKGGFYPEYGLSKRLFQLYEELAGVESILSVSSSDSYFSEVFDKLKAYLKKILDILNGYSDSGCLKSKVVNVLGVNVESLGVRDIIDIGQALFALDDVYGLFDRRKKGTWSNFEGLDNLKMLWSEAKTYWFEFCRFYSTLKIGGYINALSVILSYLEGICRQRGVIIGGEDWIDLVNSSIKQKEMIPFVFAFFGSQFRHFLFDEFQDTSRRQWDTLFPLVDEALAVGGTLFFVGDVKQAIYRWRGGDWNLFDEVWNRQELFRSVDAGSRKEELLDSNYRSHPDLVKFFNSLFGLLSNETKLKGKLKNYIKDERALDVVASSILNAYKDYIQKPAFVDNGKRAIIRGWLVESDSVDYRDKVRDKLAELVKDAWERRRSGIAVLLRRNSDVEEVSQWLIREGIPVVTENALKMEGSFVVKALLNMLDYIYSEDEISLYGILASDLFIREVDLNDTLEEMWLTQKTCIKDMIDSRIGKFKRYTTIYQLIVDIMEHFGIDSRLKQDLSPHAPFVDRLLEVAHTFDTNNSPDLGAFLDLWKKGKLESRVGLPDSVEAVHVMTIHKAKGLEFPVVFIPFTDWYLREKGSAMVTRCYMKLGTKEGNFLVELGADYKLDPYLLFEKYVRIGEILQERLNLFYVAVTRAKEELYFFVTSPRRENLASFIKDLCEDSNWQLEYL